MDVSFASKKNKYSRLLQIHHVPSEVFGQQPSTHAVEGVWNLSWDYINFKVFPFEIAFLEREVDPGR